MSGILDKIQKANDIKKIDASEYEALAQEIRDFIIKSVSETGGIWPLISVLWSLRWRCIFA